jgi:hypothetical protein
MKKLIAAMVLASLAIGVPTASATTKVTLTPQFKVSHTRPVITIKLANLPKDHGIYVQQCMAPDKGQPPTQCNPAETAKMWISNVKGDQAQGAHTGNGKISLHVDAYFKKGDCIHTTCVLFFTNDHNASSDRSEDQAIPFKFS